LENASGAAEDGAKPVKARRGMFGRRPVSRMLFHVAGNKTDPEDISIGAMILGLGDRSFGWTMLVFALVNMVPAPIGSTLILGIPLMIITAQMALGHHHIVLPQFISHRRVGRRRFKKVIMRMKPLLRPIERVVRPRMVWLFSRRNEQLYGVVLFVVAFCLFLPLPGSGFIPATALMVSSVGLIERDGVVLMAGLGIGVVSMIVTFIVAGAIVTGLMAIT
jgi:hypothetical protein